MPNDAENIPNPTPDLTAAHAALAAFLDATPEGARLVCLHDTDADGVTSGVVWQRAVERLGFPSPVRMATDRERNPWASANRERAHGAAPDRLFVLDLGSRPDPVLPGVPTCLMDHHRPEGVPPGGTLVTAYHWQPVLSTSLLVYDVFAERTDLSDVDWIAAVGLVGDYGEKAAFPFLDAAKKKYTAKYLKEAAALVNAPRRSSLCDPETAARALLTHDGPKALVTSDGPDAARLREAREEVKAALEEAKKAAPVFSGKVALIRVRSACQVHPLIAQIWRTRLPGYLVLAANDGYLPNRVNFSARSGPGVSVLDYLKSLDIGVIGDDEGGFARGHDQASGGSLTPDRWNALLRAMGFSVP